MNKLMNVSNADRIIRFVLGLVFLALGFIGVVTGGWGIFLKVVGVVFMLTGIVGFCPIYLLLGIRTKRV